MKHAQPLPATLVQRYHGWRATTFHTNKPWYQRLAREGQRPRCMVISCCDSRVHVTSIFGAEQGEFFIHRNIAALIPPFEPDGDHHGTSAAIEYAVSALQVSQIMVLGHSNCGGVHGCHEMCMGNAPELERPESFVGRWMDLLRPGFEKIRHLEDHYERLEAFEKQAVLTSLENLMTFPFVVDRVKDGSLALHGLWTDIGEGDLQIYDAETDTFADV